MNLQRIYHAFKKSPKEIGMNSSVIVVDEFNKISMSIFKFDCSAS